jgi:predicted  nucleic acid-binding Zn-ribbon protein
MEALPVMISIHCICGQRYDSERKKFHKCPHCGHVWNIFPREDHPEEAERRFQQRSSECYRSVHASVVEEVPK